MNEILEQLSTLLLGSVPTILLFLALYLAYSVLLHGPLTRTLAERRARTVGAIEQARAAIAAADTKAAQYEERLRAARADIFKAREQKLKVWATERERALAEAQAAARQDVKQAREALEHEAQDVRREIESTVDKLADEVVRAVMPASAGGAL